MAKSKQSGGQAVKRRAAIRAQRQRKRRGAYSELPEYLPEAAEFSDDPDFGDPVWFVNAIQRHPDITRDLEAATQLERHYGRKRMPGKWYLVVLAFVASGEVDIQTFWRRWKSSGIWQAAGFTAVPGPTTCWYRMTELEPHFQAFTDAANKLIRRAVKHEPRIARWVWADGTGFEVHATLEHCCPDPKACKAAGGRPPKLLDRAGSELIKTERHAESADAPRDEDERGFMEEVRPQESPNQRHPQRRRPYRYFWLGKKGARHMYRTLDPDAGARMYTLRGQRRRMWLGGNCLDAVSMFVGAPLAVDASCPANEMEYDRWPELFGKVEQATGVRPEAVVMDRLYSIKKVFEFNTRQQVASVIPWREWKKGMQREDVDTDRYDRHGVVRCKHCGGPCDQQADGLGLYFARGTPRLRVKCELRLTPDCAKTQSIACEEEWRMLTPMSRLSDTYHALAHSAKNKEHVFRHWRDRYTVAGNDVDNRPKRPGLGWQQLRAQVALLLEWFQLALRHGWIGSHRRRNSCQPEKLHPGKRLKRMLGARRLYELDLPRGGFAVAAGFAAQPPP